MMDSLLESINCLIGDDNHAETGIVSLVLMSTTVTHITEGM